MYTRDTVDGVKDKVEDALLVVASHFVFFLLRLRRTIETGTFFVISDSYDHVSDTLYVTMFVSVTRGRLLPA